MKNDKLNQKSEIRNPKYLICFDLDGVLIHSMTIANQIFFEMVENELGLSTEAIRRDKRNWAVAAQDRFETFWPNEIKERGIEQEQIDNLLARFKIRKREADTPILPYAKEAVMLMADNFEHIASVSSNSNATIEYTLEKIGLRKYFKKITGTDGLEDSKPDPAIYRTTVEYFEVDPNNTITFEDSTHGIHSAKGAGMKAIGVATGVETIEDLKKAGADIVLNDLSELTINLVYDLLDIERI